MKFFKRLLLAAAALGASTTFAQTPRFLDADFLDSGSSSSRNYIKNAYARKDTLGWAGYADSAASSPVDCTGGSPTFAISRSTTTPLRPGADFNLVKDANNRQGNGVSNAFTIDNSDKGKVLQITFPYEVVSGTYATSDLSVWIYDVTNSILIQPAPSSIESTTVQQSWRGTFQAASNSTSYRLCIHVGSTSASAYTMALSDVRVSPQIITQGTPVTDWQSYTPTYVGLGTVSASIAKYRRVGDSLEVMFTVTSGTNSGSPVSISLPSGLSMDITRAVNNSVVGALTASKTPWSGNILVATGSPTTVAIISQQADNYFNGTLGTAWANNTVFGGSFLVPITGWSSQVQMSSETDTRVVAMTTGRAATQSIPDSTGTLVAFDAAISDTHGAWNTGTSLYTIPVPGWYRITTQVSFAASSTNGREVRLRVNGSNIRTLAYIFDPTASAGTFLNGATEYLFNAGDTVGIQVFQNSGGALNVGGSVVDNYFSISRISGPSQIAASETVAMDATLGGSNQTGIATNNSFVKVAFSSAVFDTTGSFSSANSRFTAPVSGKYRISSAVLLASANVLASDYGLYLYKNGASARLFGYRTSAATTINAFNGSTTLQLNAGDYVEIFLYGLGNNSASTLTISGTTANTYFNVERVGN